MTTPSVSSSHSLRAFDDANSLYTRICIREQRLALRRPCTRPSQHAVHERYLVLLVVCLVRGPEGQVVAKQLHDQRRVLKGEDVAGLRESREWRAPRSPTRVNPLSHNL